MFDWFAARPPRTEVTTRDRPSIPLTNDERLVFESLCRQVEPQRGGAGRVLTRLRSLAGSGGLLAGLALAVAGAVWCIAWLTVSVPLSFLGVLAQAAGLRLVIDSPAVRRHRSGSVPAPAASRESTHAHRRRDR